jgi:cellulose synthase/poly-beta-1,6-N-acetylglucosamine synthase-like glycosyltransferase
MKISDVEIPYEGERNKTYRFFEILPGLLSWSILILPFILSLISPAITVFFVIAYMLLWFVKSIGMNIRAAQGWQTMKLHKKLNWQVLTDDIQHGLQEDIKTLRPKWHMDNINRLKTTPGMVKPNEVVQVAMIATYNEAREVLEPTIQSLLKSHYDMKKVILVIAYEERGGEDVEKRANDLIAMYKSKFMDAFAVKHPANIPNEVIGKGGNVTYAGREVQKYLEKAKIDPINVILTTLDADNRPHPSYLAALSYTYCMCPDPKYISFQPIPLYTNNIWDAPAPMRVVATGNSFWQTIVALRPHILRNFSSHAQSMQTLIDTDFWSVRTIVEDGHQFWRTYFRYDGHHEVYPIFLPIYQDAVFSTTYVKTLKAQFVQMRRWAWGASDVAYVVTTGFFKKNKAPKVDVLFKTLRLLEGHVSWATSALIITFSAFIPALLNPKDFGATQLPLVISSLQRVAMFGILISLFFSLKTLPPKPERYKAHRSLFMILQWVYLPITTIVYSGFSALYSQTRLMFGRYLDKFDVTDKAVVTEDNKTII